MITPCPKPEVYKNEKYLNFIRTIGVPHHVTIDHNAKGTAIKTHDYDAIPMLAEDHVRLHQMGEESFFRARVINPLHKIVYYMYQYIGEDILMFQVQRMTDEELSLCRQQLIDHIERTR